MRLIIALLLGLTPPSAAAPTLRAPLPAPSVSTVGPIFGFVRTDRLMGLCTAPEDDPEGLFDVCLGYLAGSVDQILSKEALRPKTERRVCPPEELALGEIRRAFIDFVSEAPARKDLAAAVTVNQAAIIAYPCD